MPFTNNNGQTRVGVRISPLVSQVTASTLWNSIYSVYNADWTASSSLKTSLYAVYNGELNTNDSYGINNGTAIGGLTYSTGKIGNSFKFNGTNAYVSLPDNSLNFTGDFSISLWLYHTASGNQEIISSFYYRVSPYSYSGWRLMLDNILGQTNKIGFFIPKSGATSLAYTQWDYKTTSLTLNAWNHIVIVRKSGVDTLAWVNGISQAYNLNESNGGLKTQDPTYSGLEKSSIGVAGGSTNFSLYMKANSQIDGINIWNRALTESEITELYNSGNGSQYISGDFYKPTTSDSLYLNNGTAVGGLTYVPGKVGTAFNFNGTDAYVNMGDVMNVGLSSWSYAMWFRSNQSGTYTLFSKSKAAEGTGRIWAALVNNKVQFCFSTGPNYPADIYTESTTTINLNTWYHVVFLFDRTDKLKMYINGSLETITTPGTILPNNLVPFSSVNYNNNQPFRIGSYTSSDNSTPTTLYNGQIDAFNVWNRLLTQSEITELYNSGNGVQYSNPLSPLLLDSYYGAAAAYSLRKLKNSWTGSAIKVRRSNDNVEQNIGFDASGNLDTASLLSFIGSNNISLYSEEFDNAWWTKNNVTITANQTTAPDGTMTADLLSETATTNNHSLQNVTTTSFPSGTSWNMSVYVKKGPGTSAPNTFVLAFDGGNIVNKPYALFNISTGVVVETVNASNDLNFGSSIQDAGNGWWRCSMWGTTNTSQLSRITVGAVRFNNNLNTLTTAYYAGNTQANVYVWGYQFVRALNNTSVLTTQPYTKTTATAAGNGFVTTWYDQSGNGNNLTQATSANQARIVFGGVLDTLNNKPALASNTNSAPASRYTVTFASAPISAASTFHIGSNAGSSSGFLWDGIVSSSRIYARSFNTTSIQIGRSSALALSSYTQNITTQRIINAIYNNLSSKVSINNGSYTTGGTGALSGVSGLTLGAAYDFTQGATAYYQEHIVYTSDQSINVAGINSNINTYYSIY